MAAAVQSRLAVSYMQLPAAAWVGWLPTSCYLIGACVRKSVTIALPCRWGPLPFGPL